LHVNNRALPRLRLLGSSRPLPDLDVERAVGSWLHCGDGRRILDGSSGLICANVGHNSPRVAARIAGQLARSAFVGPAVAHPYTQLELVERLCRVVGRLDDSVALTTSGTTGVEIALAIARNIARFRGGPQRRHVLASNMSYHGNSAYTLAIAGNHARRPRPEDAFGLGPAFSAPYPPAHDTGVGPDHVCDASCADEVARAIDSRGAEAVAAVILEPVNGTTGGAFVPPDGYHRRVAEICRERGVVLVHDEVLTGLWRAGKPLASHHWEGASPDICILSKGLGAGYTSVAAVLVAPELAELLRADGADPLPAMGTMAATPLQSAICLGVLDELESMNLERFESRCGRLSKDLAALTEFPAVSDVRGIGFLYGLELHTGCLWPFMEEAERRGVLFYPFSSSKGSGVTVAPPLNATDADLDHLMTVVRDTLSTLR
jgi:adenosylmethionine-8-amino-7-oxononanoate aminotransferase